MSVSLFVRDLFGFSEQMTQEVDIQDFVVVDELFSILSIDKQIQLIGEVHQSNREGEVKCVVEREYLPHLLTVNKGGI